MANTLLALSMPLLLASIPFSESAAFLSRESDEKQPVNQLVQVRGRFVGIAATKKRFQSYIFEFRVSHQMHGPHQLPTAKDQLVRFELYHGARELLEKLGGTDEKLDEIVRGLPKSPRFEVVLWLSPPVKEGGTNHVDAELVGMPVPVRE